MQPFFLGIIEVVMTMNQWIDLTMTLDEKTLVYPGDRPFEIQKERDIEADGYNLKRVHLNMHLGTHMDAPLHVIDQGKSIDEIAVDTFIGEAVVIRPDIQNNIISTQSIINQYLPEAKMILFDLSWSDKANTPDYFQMPGFEPALIPFLVKHGILAIGIDGPSPVYHQGDMLDMHKDLLSNNILIYENLVNLDRLSTLVDFIGLPLKIKGMDGSLTRAVAKNVK